MADKIMLLFTQPSRAQQNRAVIARIRYMRRKRRACFMFFVNLIAYLQQLPVRELWVKPRAKTFWSMAEDQWTNNDWVGNLRMSQVTFEKLCEELAPFVERQDTNYRKAISLRERVAITLYRLADTASYRTVSNLFGVGKSTVCQIVLEVCSSIVEVLFKRLVHLPVTRQDIETEIAAFFKRAGFPQVVGAVDGCHVAILAPNENPADYVNRKGFFSIILQGLVDSDYLFRDVYVGWPGKVHDSRVFKNSPLYDACCARTFLPMGLSKVITNVVVPPVILGDSAYGLTNWLMRPFTDRGNLTNEEVAFNTAHSKTRVVVENAFGRLKGRFRSLGKRLDQSVENATTTVTACCVLHNYCEVMKEEFDEEWLEGVQLHLNIQPCDREEKQDREAADIRNALMSFIS